MCPPRLCRSSSTFSGSSATRSPTTIARSAILAAAAPYDVVEVLLNETKYGGGGIFNQQSTVAAANESAAYVFIHELAHNLAGLGDEYVGSVTYETGAPVKAEPWEPNITALHDPSALKWRDLVEPGTPVADAAVVRWQGRRLRGCGIRSARSVSARGHVHHECAQSRRLLPCLPAGD